MSKPEYFVVGITHVDLAWKRGRAEMSEMLEIVVLRLLDSLERYPDFRYHIEQAAHFRALQKRRPDLIARLAPHLASGRLEFVGGMASTLESNLPNGECFIRNQQIGLDWVRETWGAEVTTGWLIDTFGFPAQVPQILQGFGIQNLMANRFGGSHTRDLFLAEGLDGSRVTVAGWGTYAAYIAPENLAEQFCKNWDDIENCFRKADTLTGPGPYMVIPYTENEILISLRPQQLVDERQNTRPDQTWRTGNPGDFFAALEKTNRALPVVNSDLNPEFTGCFSLRHNIRLRNRAVETLLLEAEKWAALSGLALGGDSPLADAWWELAYVQFHDVFTGSHPTVVYDDVLRVLDRIEAAAETVFRGAMARLVPEETDAAPSETASALIVSGLPWDRAEIATVPLPDDWMGIASVTDAHGEPCSFVVEDRTVRVLTDVPAVGYTTLEMQPGLAMAPEWTPADTATLENDSLRLDFDTESGIAKLVWKPTGRVLMEDANGWLVAQSDDGNFQIENPSGPEVEAASGAIRLETHQSSLGQTVRLTGTFPTLAWAGPESRLEWSAQFSLPRGSDAVHLSLRLRWRGEKTRVRLTLPTEIESSTGIYEVPFGVVRRKPYSPRANAKGEWPAHRFVALEDHENGIALVNTGVGGVEVSGGRIYTTLLRAPRAEYAGMVADGTSSQHGVHDYTFALCPYAGSWADAAVVRTAQELNNPLHAEISLAGAPNRAEDSLLTLVPQTVVLSGVKAASDGSGDVVVRVYETAGRATDTTLTVTGIASAVACDLREQAGDDLPLTEGHLSLPLKPFEIRTVRLRRRAAITEARG